MTVGTKASSDKQYYTGHYTDETGRYWQQPLPLTPRPRRRIDGARRETKGNSCTKEVWSRENEERELWTHNYGHGRGSPQVNVEWDSVDMRWG